MSIPLFFSSTFSDHGCVDASACTDLTHFPKGHPGSSLIPGNFHCDAVFIPGGMFSEGGQLLDPAPVLLLAHGEVLAINGEEMEWGRSHALATSGLCPIKGTEIREMASASLPRRWMGASVSPSWGCLWELCLGRVFFWLLFFFCLFVLGVEGLQFFQVSVYVYTNALRGSLYFWGHPLLLWRFLQLSCDVS